MTIKMKKLFFIFSAIFLLGTVSFAQNAGDGGEPDGVYTYGDLDQLGNLELTSIYIKQIAKLNRLLPYAPFNQKGEAVSLTNMGIPNTKDNNTSVKKLDNSGGTHNEVLKETLDSIVPYADKEDIISAILFVQGVTQRLESGI